MTTNTKTTDGYEHAIYNGDGWAQTIDELHDEWLAMEQLDDEDQQDEERESIEQRVYESPLSIEYRSDWVSCQDWHNDKSNEPEKCEYRILLTYGGPSLQIVGRFPGEFREYDEWMRDWEYQVREAGVAWKNIRYQLTEKQRTAITWFIETLMGGEFE